MTVRIAAPSIEHHRSALGIGESAPRLSWIVESAPSGWAQTAYEVEIDRGGSAETTAVDSRDQVLVAWPAAPLQSRERAAVRVRVAGEDGAWSEWSPPTIVEAGLLEPSDWSAQPVGAAWPEDRESDDRRPPLVRTDFEVRRRARLSPSLRDRARTLRGRAQRIARRRRRPVPRLDRVSASVCATTRTT